MNWSSMDGWSVSEWENGARMSRTLLEDSDRFRKIMRVRMNILDILVVEDRITKKEKREVVKFIGKVYHTLRTSKLPSDGIECSICLLDIDADAVITECGHMFHFKCQRSWEVRRTTCAVCRQITNKYGKKMGVTGLWLKLASRLTVGERIKVIEPLNPRIESK